MKNKGLILGIFIIGVAIAGWLFIRNMSSNGTDGPSQKATEEKSVAEETALPIPPLLNDQNPDPNKAEFGLTAQKATKEFLKGHPTETYGYNGDYLGPVIRVKNGESVSVKVKNELDETTTLHWHGLEVDGEQDGGPHSGIQPGTTWNPQFTIDQPAATLWYHPHLFHKTGEQVYKGLAGLFLIDDTVSDSLDIPKDYGINDIPLVIQDKNLGTDGQVNYNLSMHDVMMGLQGDTILVNGAVNPYLEVPKGKVRLRLVNGSNARIYQFKLSNGQDFHQIASDGGFLETPVQMSDLILSSGERAEIIIDFSSNKKGDIVNLMDQGFAFMKFKVTDKKTKNSPLPKKLASVPKIDDHQATQTREFVMQGMGQNVTINGKQMDMNRIDEELNLNDTEIWEISNETTGMMGGNGGMAHPFHAHGVQFQILDRDGKQPPANERGWKDTILVYPGEKVRAIATFSKKGLFMYHCHILEHEDAGMMGQFKVE